MELLKTLLHLGVCLAAWSRTSADESLIPTAENLRWISLDFTTILTWTVQPSDYTYTVLYSADEGDWIDSSDCIQVTEGECDLTNDLNQLDRSYTADVRTEPGDSAHSYDVDNFPHAYSSEFNPYRQSNISAVKFSVQAVDESRVSVNITDPLTAIHRGSRQLSIRDILQNDLKYKISYYKAGSTGKRDFISDSSTAEVSNLDSGENYCFIVAAFIPSRAKAAQQGAWSTQHCTQLQGTTKIPTGLSLGALVGIIFILLTILIVFITVTVLCCKCCRQRNKSFQTSQTSGPV